LLIPLDNGTLGEIGASWLFTRYMVDQFGSDLPRKLVQTTLIGTRNVAAQTGQSFATDVTHWGLANWVSDLPGFATPSELEYKTWNFRVTYNSLNAQDPQDFPAKFPLAPTISTPGTLNASGVLPAGSPGMYIRLVQPPGDQGSVLHFGASLTQDIKASVVP